MKLYSFFVSSDKHILVHLCVHLQLTALASDSVSSGYSGAEIVALCRDAALHAIGEMDDGVIDKPQIHMRHLLQSINNMKPRTTQEMLDFYSGGWKRQ